MSTDIRTRIPRTAIIATPAGTYLAIVGPFGNDWDGVTTGVVAGGTFVVLLFAPSLLGAMSKAAKASAARRKVKAAKQAEKAKKTDKK